LISQIEGETKAEGVLVIGLGNIFGSKRDEVAGDWRRLLNGVLCDL